MAETVQGICDALTQEASFDVTTSQALLWLNRRHKLMVRRAKALKETVAVGSTVAGTADYSLPAGVVEVYEFDVGGLPFSRGRRTDIASNNQGLLWLYSPTGAGIVVANATSGGVTEFTIVPTPVDVQAISVYAAMVPADLVIGTDSTLLVPDAFVEGLIAGGLASGYWREGNANLAQVSEQRFDQACEEWRRSIERQERGRGAAQVRVVGFNA